MIVRKRMKYYSETAKGDRFLNCMTPNIFYLVGGFNPFEKYARQIGNLPQVGMKIKNNLNHHLVYV